MISHIVVIELFSVNMCKWTVGVDVINAAIT